MAPQPDLAFLDHLTETLAGTWPAGSAEDCPKAARAALDALQPRDIVEAMLAARMIAAHHATMDDYRRAMQPGISDADSVRLRNNAIAAARSFDAALRTLDKRRSPGTSARGQAPGSSAPRIESGGGQAPTDKPSQPHKQAAKAQPVQPTPPAPRDRPPPEADAPFPSRRQYVPRDKHGEPIKLWRWEDMTMAQRRAAYGDPDNAEVQAIALAEEAAMIEAEQDANRQVRGGE
jgi:hypothetical protein